MYVVPSDTDPAGNYILVFFIDETIFHLPLNDFKSALLPPKLGSNHRHDPTWTHRGKSLVVFDVPSRRALSHHTCEVTDSDVLRCFGFAWTVVEFSHLYCTT